MELHSLKKLAKLAYVKYTGVALMLKEIHIFFFIALNLVCKDAPS